MKPDIKYYLSQVIAIPTVALPSVISALILGGLTAKLAGEDGSVGTGVICISVGYATYKLTSLITGRLLEEFGLLPRGAWRVYPHASSWGGYLKEHWSIVKQQEPTSAVKATAG
jgi:hypothetical protein